jgi:hypothetical protein
MRMKKRRRLLKILRTVGTKYVLHGHIHRNEIYERNGIQLANGAGAVCDDPVRNLKYNSLSSVNGMCELSTRHLAIPFQASGVTQAIIRRPKHSITLEGILSVTKESSHASAAFGSIQKIS